MLRPRFWCREERGRSRSLKVLGGDFHSLARPPVILVHLPQGSAHWLRSTRITPHCVHGWTYALFFSRKLRFVGCSRRCNDSAHESKASWPEAMDWIPATFIVPLLARIIVAAGSGFAAGEANGIRSAAVNQIPVRSAIETPIHMTRRPKRTLKGCCDLCLVYSPGFIPLVEW